MEVKFSRFLTGLEKNHNNLNALLRVMDNWKVQLKNEKVGVIILDLTKAFNTLNLKP